MAAGSTRCECGGFIVLVDHRQRIALEKTQPLAERPPRRRAVDPVIGHRRRREDDALAEEIQPPAEIDVLEVGEEILVEAASVEEGRAGEQRGSGAGGQQRSFVVRARRRLVRNPAATSGR